ncbi:hypothetical protein LIER_29597 [Lithospermum erythrorhizon]|uniref:Uncharacterized protein n=1 Tax=Lithospermum erythrorhizon TaxID=34254 RepID=A0AAV3RLF9_LITER
MQLLTIIMGWSAYSDFLGMGTKQVYCLSGITSVQLCESESSRFGDIHCSCLNLLLMCFSYGLEKDFREELYHDFEQLTLDFYKKGDLYGLEKYW